MVQFNADGHHSMTSAKDEDARAPVPLEERSKEAPEMSATNAAGTLEIQGQGSLRAWELRLRGVPAGGSLLSIDVGGFVHVNHVLQRLDGEQTRRDCAELLKEFLPAGSLVSRWRRDAVMAYVRDASKALDVAERFREAVEGIWTREQARIREPSREDDRRFIEPLLAISIGVAAYDGDVVRSTRAADAASFDARRRGLNQVVDART
jgi:GGDEF domain-containing protein